MRFAAYHPWVYLTGGAERTLLELMRRSRHDWVLHTHRFDAETTFPGFADLEVQPLATTVSVRRSFVPLAHAAASMALTSLPDTGARGLLVSSEGLGDLVARRSTVPTAVYCHTPLKILHDPVTRAALRERAPGKSRVLDLLGTPFHTVDKALWRHYDHVFANSSETRRRITESGLAPADRVEVLYPGVDSARSSGTPDTWPRRPQFLVAGRIQWQKRIETAIDALRLARKTPEGAGLSLVIAGAVDGKSAEYLATLRGHAQGLPVTFVVNPDDATLDRLYGESTALLFTAPNEDFGIVPLEAMSAGTPVIAVDHGGPRETVLHGVTGWLVPSSAYRFALQMLTVAVSDPVDMARMRAAARLRAAQFCWEPLVSRIDDVMEALALGERDLEVLGSGLAALQAFEDVPELTPRVLPGAWRRLRDLELAAQGIGERGGPVVDLAS